MNNQLRMKNYYLIHNRKKKRKNRIRKNLRESFGWWVSRRHSIFHNNRRMFVREMFETHDFKRFNSNSLKKLAFIYRLKYKFHSNLYKSKKC